MIRDNQVSFEIMELEKVKLVETVPELEEMKVIDDNRKTEFLLMKSQ
jgi:hypothetical protein